MLKKNKTQHSAPRRARRLDLDVPIAVTEPERAADLFAGHLPVVPLELPVNAEPGLPDASSAPAAIASSCFSSWRFFIASL